MVHKVVHIVAKLIVHKVWWEFVQDFKPLKTDQQGLCELWEIKQRKVQPSYKMMQGFKDGIFKLSYPIDPNHEQDWFIKVLFQLTWMTPTKQKCDTL